MNLTFLDSALWWDIIFIVTLLLCIHGAANRGAFRALSGITGTVLGVILGNLFQGGLVPIIEPILQPVMQALARKADLSQVTGLQEGSLLSDLVARGGALTDKVGELYQSLMTTLADTLTKSLAPILSFLIIFFVTKLGIRLICALLDLDLPILSGLNRMAGGVLGAVAGVMVILVLCWAVMHFAPAENVGLLSRPCLQESFLGGLLTPLFVSATL